MLRLFCTPYTRALSADFFGEPSMEPDGCLGRRAEAHGRWSRTGTVLRRRWKRHVSGAVVSHVVSGF